MVVQVEEPGLVRKTRQRAAVGDAGSDGAVHGDEGVVKGNVRAAQGVPGPELCVPGGGIIGQDDVGGLAQIAEKRAQPEGRSHGVPVGPDVGEDHKLLPGQQGGDDFLRDPDGHFPPR